MLKQLQDVGEKHMKDEAVKGAETLGVKVYVEALASLTKQRERLALLQKPRTRRD
jgi:hypothetical protein